MRPVLRPNHLVAVAILTLVAMTYGYLSVYDGQLARQQIHAVTAAVKNHDQSLMANDQVFGDSQLWRRDLPLPQSVLTFALSVRGFDDLSFPFISAVAPVTLIYLIGMYALLVGQCRSWKVAVFVSVLSSRIVHTLGRHYWGFGSLGSATPQGLFIAFTPWVILGFLTAGARWRLLGVFLAIGLLGNLYLTGAVNLVLVLAVVFLIHGRFSGRSILITAAAIACAAVAMAPAVWHYVALRRAIAGAAVGPAVQFAAAEVLRIGRLDIMLPDVLAALVDWLIPAAVLAVPSAAVLVRGGRFRVRNLWFWCWLAGVSAVVGVGLHAGSLAVGMIGGSAPPTIGILQAFGFVMLPLYVFFAAALTSVFRMIRSVRLVLSLGCGVLLIGWLLPSDNLRVLRYQLQEAATYFIEDEDKPRHILRHRIHRQAEKELRAIAAWARLNSDPQAVFLIDSIKFRMLARRAVPAAGADVAHLYLLAPRQLGTWHQTLREQDQLLAAQASDNDVSALIAAWRGRGMFPTAKQWYVVVHADNERGAGLEEITSDAWGKSYRLLAVP